MRMSSRAACRYGQWSLVGSLISIAIILILAAVYLPRLFGHKATATSPAVASPQQRAYGAACGEYLSQINLAVQQYKTDNDDKVPAKLDDLKKYGVTDDMIHAPGCAFQIDPATGQVTDTGKGNGPGSSLSL